MFVNGKTIDGSGLQIADSWVTLKVSGIISLTFGVVRKEGGLVLEELVLLDTLSP